MLSIYVKKCRVYTVVSCPQFGHDFRMTTNVAKKDPPERNAVSVALGKSLKKLRISRDLSQETLAFTAEVDRTFISAIERGVANPSTLTLANICFALGATMAELFESVQVSVPPNSQVRRKNQAKPEAIQRARLR